MRKSLMNFKITGSVSEKESGLAVEGLMIRAYDKDMLYDDLLGNANTDEQGKFEIVYSKKDFSELFETKPDIYLSLYAPPCKFLMNTRDSVCWNASECENFNLEIDRETLGPLAPSLPDDEVEGRVLISADDVVIERRDGYDRPRLPGFALDGAPGAPALPEQKQFVALPMGGDVLSLEVTPGDPIRMAGEVNPLPVQEPMPDVGIDPKQFGDGFSIDNIDVEFTSADSRYYKAKTPYPEKLVELDRVENIGPIQVAAIRVRPMQYDPNKKSYLYYPELSYRLKYDLENARKVADDRDDDTRRVGQLYSEQVSALLQTELFNAGKFLYWPSLIIEDLPYIIITDNFQWPESIDRGDGTTRAPELSERGPALNGDLAAEFERLAQWKTSRGVRTRVFTISDIVDGQFGDFTENGFARDLQEVIRNFAKHAQKNWDSLYLLLGGDVNVVPMRRLAGCSTYGTVGCGRVAENPPAQGRCHFVAGKSVVKLNPKFTPASNAPLSSQHGGVRVAFDREAGPGRLGWYFTNEGDFTSRNEGFTRLPDGQSSRFIIVEGPESVIDDNYYWMRDVNLIPSDLYYSSLVGARYSIPGKHDFDDNNNEIYGQYHWVGEAEVSLDGVDFWPDVWVGRASAENDDQARGFVDKIITYERLQGIDGESSVDTTYLQKIIYASAYWGRKYQSRQADTSIPPAEGKFTHEASSTTTRIQTQFDLSLSSGVPSRRLVARFASSEIVIPYNTSANATSLGWHFTTSDSYTSLSTTPTRFIRMRGPESDIDPSSNFFWDPVGLELAADEKEALRVLMDGWFPNFSTIQRHYEDYFDLTTPPPHVPLDSTVLRDAIDNGVHFLSLTGHGWSGGCCGINTSSQPDFSNENRYFIAFADSCSTARPDGADSTAEVSTLDPDGGAVAYVGNTRYSWIGVGDNYERFFWGKLRILKRAGPAAGLRLATGGMRRLWTLYSQTLFGDPEMPVWTSTPSSYEVTHSDSVAWGGRLNVTVRKLGSPVSGQRVTLMGGWVDSSVKPRVFTTKITNGSGQASFTLPSKGSPLSELQLTVSNTNFIPFVSDIAVNG